MAEYIEREAVIKEAFCIPDEEECGCGTEAVLISDIKKIPAADVVEVVRCKDCKFWNCYGGEESHKGDCLELEIDTCMYEDDFCSYGDKKND